MTLAWEPAIDPATRATRAEVRLDWRFLLPEARLGRVAVDGPIDGELLRALEGEADRVAPLTDGSGPQLVVLARPTPRDVRRAVAELAPGGAIRIEDQARRHRGRTRRLLQRQGFDVSTWWHRPSVADARCLVAVDHAAAAATVLRTVGDRGRRAPFEAGLAWGHLVRSLASGVATMAVAPAAPDGPANGGVDGSRPAATDGGGRHATAPKGTTDGDGTGASGHRPPVASVDGEPVVGLLTPRFAASRAVIGVTTGSDGHHLSGVVKVARHRHDEPMLEAEAAALDRVAAVDGLRHAVPGHHRLEAHGDRVVLVEDAAPGRPLDRRAVRRDPQGALEAAVRWVERLPVGPTGALGADGRADELLLDPLRRVARLPMADTEAHDALIRRAAGALAPLALAVLPAPFEHGDLCHPNLFRRDDGELVVIDWERARAGGLPFHDLTFLVAYLAASVDRATSPEAQAVAERRATDPGGWAEPILRDHAERTGVDDALRPRLALASWTRTLARLAETPELAARPTSHRWSVLWRAAIERAEERP